MSIYEGFPIAMFDYRKVIGDGLYLSHIIVVSALLRVTKCTVAVEMRIFHLCRSTLPRSQVPSGNLT